MPAKLLSLPEFMTAAQIAEWRGVTKASVYGWKRAGKIAVHHQMKGSKTAMYCTDALLRALGPMPDDPPEWYEPAPDDEQDAEGPADYTREHARLERAKRVLAELKVEEQRGTLVNAAAARKAWADVGAATRQRVLGIIPRVRDELAAMDSPHDVARRLEDELREALTMTEADLMGDA